MMEISYSLFKVLAFFILVYKEEKNIKCKSNIAINYLTEYIYLLKCYTYYYLVAKYVIAKDTRNVNKILHKTQH